MVERIGLPHDGLLCDNSMVIDKFPKKLIHRILNFSRNFSFYETNLFATPEIEARSGWAEVVEFSS